MAEVAVVKNPLFAVFKLNANNAEGYAQLGANLGHPAVYAVDGDSFIRVDFAITQNVTGQDKDGADIIVPTYNYLNIGETVQFMTDQLFHLYNDATIVECVRYNSAPAGADHGTLDPKIIAALKSAPSFVELGVVK